MGATIDFVSRLDKNTNNLKTHTPHKTRTKLWKYRKISELDFCERIKDHANGKYAPANTKTEALFKEGSWVGK